MLPSQDPQMLQVEALIVICVPNLATGHYVAANCLGWDLDGVYPLFQVPNPGSTVNISVIFQSSDALAEELLEAADALLLILDGELGLDAASMSIWAQAADSSIPRHLGAVHVTTGRADFDELIAIATRVLEPDLMVRYLPIEAEDDDSLVGQYDLLTADIHDCSTGSPQVRHGDPEHVALTADRRDDLFEELAHAGLADDSLATHRQGLPVSIPALTTAWADEHIVSITALDNQTGAHILKEWFVNLPSRWLPVVMQDEQSRSITESVSRVGVGVGPGIARMWGPFTENEQLEATGDDVTDPIVAEHQNTGFILARGISFGQTVRVAGSSASVLMPRF